jgi:hypothetical protein
MTRCLEDKTLFLLSEGEASEEQRSHLQSCQACTERYREIERDLRLITHTLQQEPAPFRFATPRAPIFLRSLPIAAGVLLAIALMWGESRLWRPDSSSEQTLSGDLSQFLEQVSEAIFDGGNIGEVETSSSDSDLASLQVALGENCSDDCRGLFNNSLSTSSTKLKTKTVDRPVVTAKRRPIDPTMQRMVSDRAE